MRQVGRFWDRSRGVHLKICGVRNLDVAYSCYELGVDAIGLHGFGDPERFLAYAEWTHLLPAEMSVFLLTADEDPVRLLELCRSLRCDTVQLQGQRPVLQVRAIAAHLRSNGIATVKSVGVSPRERPEELKEYIRQISGHVDGVLFDSGWRGGTGRCVDLNAVKELMSFADPAVVIVAGGISAGNVGEVMRAVHPYAVDVQSSVEWVWLSQGRRVTAKSVKKIEELVVALRQCC